MNETRPVCERCGAPARVHTSGHGADGRKIRHLCLACADAEEADAPARERGLNHAAILLSVGVIVLLLSLLADVLKFGQEKGFGWKQQSGILVGGILVLSAALLRIPTLLVIGLVAAALSTLADHLGFGSGEGFGSHQILGVAAGILLIVAGLLMRRRA